MYIFLRRMPISFLYCRSVVFMRDVSYLSAAFMRNVVERTRFLLLELSCVPIWLQPNMTV